MMRLKEEKDESANMGYRDHIGIWERELNAWVPDEIFDAHVHLGRTEDMNMPFSAKRLKNALCTFSGMTHDEMRKWHRQLYGGKRIVGLCAFPFPLLEMDYVRANTYLTEVMAADPRVKGFIWTNQRDISATIDVFEKAARRGVRFTGAKPYYDLLGKSNFDTAMAEILPRKLLEFINAEKLVVMLHTTGKGIGEQSVRDYLAFMLDNFPDIKIVLAHMGRHLSPADFEKFMSSGLWQSPSLYLEMSSSSQTAVYEMALSEAPLCKRLLFGSDIPFGLITGMEQWSETAGAIFKTRDRYTWSDSVSWGDAAMTYNTWHVIKAFKDAVSAMKLPPAAEEALKKDVFSHNALALSGEK